MSLLKKLIEMGVTSAGSIATTQGGFARPRKKRKTTMIRRITDEGSLIDGGVISRELTGKKAFTFKDALRTLAEDITGGTDADTTDVVSKLEAAQKKSKVEKDTRTFGLEDDKGNVVRVYVRSDQADEFEKNLEHMLSGNDDNDDRENTSMEIAEVLFKLKDKFDIVDVNWGDIPEDEEDEQTVEDGDNKEDGDKKKDDSSQEGDENTDTKDGKEGELAPGMEDDAAAAGGPSAGADTGGANDALNKVIDMLKADADAKKAEANARAAEARAKEAEFAAKAAASKVKQEEEVLDMETHEKEQKGIEKEAKQLARLAKYRHQKAAKAGHMLHSKGGSISDTEEEEIEPVGTPEEMGGNRFENDPDGHHSGTKSHVSIEDLRDMIYTNLQGN